MNVWTRQKHLIEEQTIFLRALVNDKQALNAELDNDDWLEASKTAERIRFNASRMQAISNELEDVTGLIDTFDSITKRMEKLEKQSECDCGMQDCWRCNS